MEVKGELINLIKQIIKSQKLEHAVGGSMYEKFFNLNAQENIACYEPSPGEDGSDEQYYGV